MKPEAEWLSLPEGVTPALVDRDFWEATQKQCARNTGAGRARNQARPYLLRNPSLIAAEFELQRQEGPDQRLLADKDALQRSLAKLGQQQGKLLRLFRGAHEEQFPVDFIQRELAQIEKEKVHLTAALTQIEAQLAVWQVSIERWDNLTICCQDIAQNLGTFDYKEEQLMLDVLAITVVADGRDWRVSGSMPRNEQAGILSQSS